jgi:hypothetical protein
VLLQNQWLLNQLLQSQLLVNLPILLWQLNLKVPCHTLH